MYSIKLHFMMCCKVLQTSIEINKFKKSRNLFLRVSKELFPQMVQKTIFRWNLISKIASIFHETAKISSNKVHDSSLEIPCFSLYPTLSLITAKFPYDFNLNRKNLIMHLKTFLKLCLTRVLPF